MILLAGVPLFVNKGKPKQPFTWAGRRAELAAKRERMKQYAIEKAEREHIAAEEAAAKANEEELERLRIESETASSSASSYGYMVGEGSPSPNPLTKGYGAQYRKYDHIFDRMGATSEQLHGFQAKLDAAKKDARNFVYDPEPDEDENDPYVIRRKKLARDSARIKRIVAGDCPPLFVNKNTDIAAMQAGEAARLERRRARGEPEQTEAELDPTWGSRSRGHPTWAKKIMHPELYEDEVVSYAEEDKVHALVNELLPSIEVLPHNDYYPRPTSAPSSYDNPADYQAPAYYSSLPRNGIAPPSLRPPHTRTYSAPSYNNKDMDNTTHGSPTSSPSHSPAKSLNRDVDSMWNGELEFTEDSIEVSMSPQLKIRRLETMREQEIRNASARSIAVTQLERIREKNSEERSYIDPDLGDISEFVSQRYVSELSPEFEARGMAPNFEDFKSNIEEMAPKDHQSPSATAAKSADSKFENLGLLPENHQSPEPKAADSGEAEKRVPSPVNLESLDTSIGEGFQIPNTPVTIYSAHAYHKKHPIKTEEELRAIREESYDALRQLSRSLSRSPPNQINTDVDPEERITAEAKLFELQDNLSASASGKNSARAPSPPPSEEEPEDEFEVAEETPKSKRQDPLTMPTPRVMGAFIETPAPTVHKPRLEVDNNKDAPVNTLEVIDAKSGKEELSRFEHQNRTKVAATAANPTTTSIKREPYHTRPRPPLINTAPKFSVLDDIRRLKNEIGIDDSIDDFDSLLAKPLNVEEDEEEEDEPASPIDDLITGIIKDKTLFDKDVSGRALSTKERERRLEDAIMDRMAKHLARTSSSLRDTRYGIERIEKQVQTTIGKPSAFKPVDNKKLVSIPIAEKAADGTIYVKMPIPHLWKYDPQTQRQQQKFFSRKWKFTWLGFVLTMFIAWFFAETTMCHNFCHPQYGTGNTIWHYDDPFFPYAIPTKLDQWTGKVASNAMYNVLEFIDDIRTGEHNRGTKFREAYEAVPAPTRTTGTYSFRVEESEGPDVGVVERYDIWGDEIVE